MLDDVRERMARTAAASATALKLRHSKLEWWRWQQRHEHDDPKWSPGSEQQTQHCILLK